MQPDQVESKKVLRVAFVTRAFPPVIGGIEAHNHAISEALKLTVRVDLIANRHGKVFLIPFLFYALYRSLLVVPKSDVILLGDAVLAPLGVVLKKIFHKPVVCVVHGLDITFRHPLYQWLWVQKSLPVLDGYIAVGNETIRQGASRGLDARKFCFIPNGVSMPAVTPADARASLANILGLPAGNAFIVLTLGRLVARKGVAWFIEQVMPSLPDNVIYVVAGDGKERERIRQAICLSGMSGRVICLGKVDDAQKELLYNAVDMFVQPNLAIAGDMEGFGLVVLEAAAHGLWVLASAVDGLKDAIHDGNNGKLVATGDAVAWAEAVTWQADNLEVTRQQGIHARDYVSRHYSWEDIAHRYVEFLHSTVVGKQGGSD